MIDTSNYETNKANLEAYGFKIVTWDGFLSAKDRPDNLLSRALEVTHERQEQRLYVVYDPEGDHEGWLLIGPRDDIAVETVEDIISQEPEEGPLAKSMTRTNLYTVDLMIAATVYIKADTLDEAKTKLRDLHQKALELGEDSHQQVPISGASYDSPKLPEASLSPAMTILVNGDDVGSLELTQEGVPA